ncbi:AfsR/SARP family transcriptional regulator [Paractinoplanes rishiriensis]|uniref:SARP family transcriptional regulator n=1 Tax=Paractinoplanes rishiriensis TaxID=1050105 RepID=A0A919MY57_9ACTN|nr:BTAD domain-containing putative transcriptional regulator [Actinoplanes rishiriensis]GIE96590.1 SARP family transcriptional regulator [Actinoplanes rishiriensis]
MDFRILGPLDTLVCGQAARRQQLAVLAVLVVDAGRAVPVDTLVDRVWDGQPPPQARRTLHTHITRIRRLLEAAADGAEPVRLLRGAGGYLLDTEPDTVDLHRFQRLVDRARRLDPDDPERAVLLRTALDLWSSEPLAGLTGAWADRMRESWRQQWLDAVVDWGPAETRAGNPGAVIARLSGLVTEYPLVEPLAAALMRAQYAAGRAAEALDHYTTVRQQLAEELGTDPGTELRQLHQAILRGDLESPAKPRADVPAQLPVGVRGFTGRTEALAELNAVLAGSTPPAVPICVVSGTAGVGKTALAVHWAHQVAARFPDGQLYLNLRGFDPGGSAMRPAEAVRAFLDGWQVPPQRIPSSPAAQESLYRSMFAGRRVLVVLDNAREAEQVRPLLPGTPGCLVVVTSRDQLSGLVAIEGAHPVPLDLLPADEARELLAGRLGTTRAAAEPEAVDRIAASCARLPLALAIVAARAVTNPVRSLGVLAADLGGLDAFDGGERVADVRAVFSWSYRILSPAAGRLFRLLGLRAGPDLSLAAAASLAGVPTSEVRPLLVELTRAHLVAEHSQARYAMHDLLRAYATELSGSLDAPADRLAAQRRVLGHLLHSASAATMLLNRHRNQIALVAADPGVTAERFTDHAEALTWFVAERAVLLAAVEQAAAIGLPVHSWQLVWALATFMERQGHWQEWFAAQQIGLAAARDADDRTGQVHGHRFLATAAIRLGRLDEARTHLRQTIALAGELGAGPLAAFAHMTLAHSYAEQGEYDTALDSLGQAIALYRANGRRAGEADALSAAAWCHIQRGEHESALTICKQALVLDEEIGNLPGAAATWDSLGYARHHLGEYPDAIADYGRAIDLYRRLGDRRGEADTLDRLGDTHDAAGDAKAARVAWQAAVDILDEQDQQGATDIHVKLRSSF